MNEIEIPLFFKLKIDDFIGICHLKVKVIIKCELFQFYKIKNKVSPALFSEKVIEV